MYTFIVEPHKLFDEYEYLPLAYKISAVRLDSVD